MGENEHLSNETREKILKISMELFAQFGFKSVTMDDIAYKSGLSKKTVYLYFDNKKELVTDTLSWHHQCMRNDCITQLSQCKDSLEVLVRTSLHLESIFKKINPIALNELHRFFNEGYQHFRANIEQFITFIKNNLETGIKEGIYRENINPEVLSRFHVESLWMIMMPNQIIKNSDDIGDYSNEILCHFIYGILNAKGLKLYEKYKEKYYNKL